MADNTESNTQTNTLFNKLKKMFSSDVIVRNVGGKKLKIIDTDSVEFATDKNSLRDRYNRLRSSTYNLHNRDMSLAYQAARLELFRDYDCVGEDTIVPLPDGSRPTIKELAEKYKDTPSERFHVFSYDHSTNSVKLGNAYHPRKKTGGTRKCWKVTLDDGKYVVGSAGHPFLMRTGEYKKLEDVTVGESVMPFYQSEYGYKKHGFKRYRRVYNFCKGWQAEHKVVAEQFNGELKKNELVHHKNFNGSDNSPDNLVVMDAKVHAQFHQHHNKTVLWGDANYDVQLKKLLTNENYINRKIHHWNGERTGENNPFHGKVHTAESNEKRSKSLKEALKDIDTSGAKNPNYRDELTIEVLKVKAIEHYKQNGKLTSWGFVKDIGCDYSVLQNRLKSNKTDWKSFKNEIESTLNHKIVSIEYIGEKDVYDVTVEKYQNFACDSCFLHNTMDADPILSSALDVYSEESVTPNEFGNILTITSSDENIKKILENLFNDILNIEFNLHSWARSLAKYGDFFLRMDISPEYGVYLVKPLSAYEITRVEGSDPKNINYVKFQHDGLGGGQEYENFEMAHFRLMSDSNFMPYGKSMLEPARRIWKQLSLAEDAMLIHRIVRAPEKRIFKVDVGNIPPVEVDGYIEKLMNKAKKVPYIDERTGDYNLRYNLNNMLEDFWLPVRGGDSGTSIDTLPGMEFTGIEDLEYLRNKMMAALKIPKAFLGYDEAMCLALDTKIPLLNGTDKTLTELIDEHSRGIKNYVYSIDETTKLIVPGEITWAGITRRNTSTVKIWLDNGECVQSTPDHLFLTRDGKWIAAEKLEINQSLMPLYKKNEIMYKKSDYEMVYQPGTDNWQWTHRMVESHNPISPPIRGTVIHHVDFNRKNNNPSNLERMTWVDHREIHMKNVYKTMCSPAATLYKKSAEFSAKKSAERLKYINANPQEVVRLKNNLAQYTMSREELSTACTTGWKNSQQSRLDKLTETNKKYNKQSIMQKAARMCRGFTAPLPTMVELKTHIQSTAADNLSDIAIKLNCGSRFLSKLLHENGYSNAYELFNEILGFKSGRPASVTHDLYMKLVSECGSVDGVAEQYKLSKKQRVTFYKSKPLNHKVVKIEHCTELIDTGDITVAEHHNFATCAGVIVHNSGKSTLAMEDLRFARTIGRIQRIIVSELTKIAIVHLFVQGYTDASLVDFDLKLSNPSTVFEQEKIQIWQDKVNLAKDMMESNSFSRKWLYEKLWGMSDDEVASIKSEIIEDKKQEWRVEQITAEGNDPMTSNQKVGADGEMSDTGGDTGDGDMGGDLPDMGGDAGGADASGDVPDLPELTESDDPEEPTTRKEKDDRNDKRDQTGEKKNSDFARKHPFGEDHMGKSGIGVDSIIPRNCRTTLPHPVRENNRSNKITLASMSEDLKSIKKTLGQRKMIKNQKSVISETTSMLDEANLIDDAKIE